MSLFRQQAIESKRLDWMGKHALTLAKTSRLPWVVSVSTVMSIVALTTFGSYGVNIEVLGVVSFRPGVYTLTAPLAGVVTFAKTIEGETLVTGEKIYTITSKIMRDGEEKHEKKEALIREKIASLEARKAAIGTSLNRLDNDLGREIALKQQALSDYQQLLKTGEKKIALAQKRSLLFAKHHTRGIISEMEYHDAAHQLLVAEDETQRVKVSISQVNYDLTALRIACNKERYLLTTKDAEYTQQLADARQELTDATSEASTEVSGPLPGKLGYAFAQVGDAVKKGDVLGGVLPAGAQPTIALHVPSAAVGEIHPGQRVKIRVSSFPWRRYGKLNGNVITVSPTAVRTPEGMFFSVTVAPDANPAFRLQQGMEVTANIITGNKRVYQWLFGFMAAQWKN